MKRQLFAADSLRGFRLSLCDAGVALVEFALILPVLLLFVLGALEIGYKVYAMSVVNGALREAARMASTGEYTGAQIDAKVTDMIHDFRASADVDIVKRSYSDFTGVGIEEPIVGTGTKASGNYCFMDVNGSGKFSADMGRDGLGGPEDVIYYEVTMSYPTLMPYTKLKLGLPDLSVTQQNTIVSNEPYAAVSRPTPVQLCCNAGVGACQED